MKIHLDSTSICTCNGRLRTIYINASAMILLVLCCSAPSAETQLKYTNHDAAMFGSLQSCIDAIQAFSPPFEPKPQVLVKPGESINVLSWNVEKGSHPGWLQDLNKLAKGRQLILLQEALLSNAMRLAISQQAYWSFAPGYQTDTYRSGLLLLSKVPPDIVCRLQALEPWLRSPKATGVAFFSIPEQQTGLLVINLHAVNFSFGLDDFKQQLAQVSRLLESVQGPAIVAGDFNTWSKDRLDTVTQIMAKAGMQAVSFKEDKRVKVFGLALDHIWLRGGSQVKSDTTQVSTSDHNPLMTTFRLCEKRRLP